MKPIDGKAKTLAEVLKGNRYSIDYYQREYKWQQKQILELISDLTQRFAGAYEAGHKRKAVDQYPYYFIGSIIISDRDSVRYVVDGQQRMTSLTLLLTYLHRQAAGRPDVDPFDDLIYSTKFGEKSFNLDVDDRIPAMTALFEGGDFDITGSSESVQNLVGRFADIEREFPAELTEDALAFFVDWLLHKVQVVEITAYSDDDAYTIFETMNDRGLKLTPADMLKGYLLANIADPDDRARANNVWRNRMRELAAVAPDTDADFLKTWLRSQYADKIRERKKGAVPEDWDRIGTEFHRWLRSNAQRAHLVAPDDFTRMIELDFAFYSHWYLVLLDAATSTALKPGLEHVAYNADRDFTLQFQLLLAPLRPDDDDATVRTKFELVARYVDIVISRRVWNSKSIAYSTMSYAMFVAMKAIRGKTVPELASLLHSMLAEQSETFDFDRLRMHQQNRWQLHRTIARLTDFVGVESGEHSRYVELLGFAGKKYEVEHIWANHPEDHADEFANAHDFGEHRNLVGDLLVVPKSFNASYGDDPYAKKVEHYLKQNHLARSLHPLAYENDPGFLGFIKRTGLAFRSYEVFNAAAIEERSALYRQLAKLVWNPDDLLAHITDV
jgi:hypothetical protein